MVNRCPCRTARRGCIMDRGRTRLPENGSAVDLARATPPGPGVTPQRFAPSDYLGRTLSSREACGTARRTHPRFSSAARIEIGSSPRAPQPSTTTSSPPPIRSSEPCRSRFNRNFHTDSVAALSMRATTEIFRPTSGHFSPILCWKRRSLFLDLGNCSYKSEPIRHGVDGFSRRSSADAHDLRYFRGSIIRYDGLE